MRTRLTAHQGRAPVDQGMVGWFWVAERACHPRCRGRDKPAQRPAWLLATADALKAVTDSPVIQSVLLLQV